VVFVVIVYIHICVDLGCTMLGRYYSSEGEGEVLGVGGLISGPLTFRAVFGLGVRV
jgi:Rieske Fe-S protein